MTYYLDGVQLEPGIGFNYNGIKYPGNWLELSTEAEKAELGVIKKDQPVFDDRFYYIDTTGAIQSKPIDMLRQFWIGIVKKAAYSNLAISDWYFIRQAETGVNIPQSVLDRRAEIRTLSNDKEAVLEATTTTDELAAYVTGPEFNVWKVIVPETGNDTLTFEQP